MNDSPTITKELIDYLVTKFPDFALSLGDIELSDRHIWFRAGQIAVVRHLRQVMEDQQENILQRD